MNYRNGGGAAGMAGGGAPAVGNYIPLAAAPLSRTTQKYYKVSPIISSASLWDLKGVGARA